MSSIYVDDKTTYHATSIDRAQHLMRVVAVMNGRDAPAFASAEMINVIDEFLHSTISDLIKLAVCRGVTYEELMTRVEQAGAE